MSKKYSELLKAAMENVAAFPATLKKGLMYFNSTSNRPGLDDGTDVSQVMLEKHLPEARRATKVQLDDVGTGNEIDGVLPYTKGGTGVSNLTGFGRKALTVKETEDGYEFGDAGGGAVFEANQVAHGLTALDVIYHNGTSWVKAQANAGDTIAEYMVVEVFDVDNFKAAKFGKFEITAHGLTVGEHYFLSSTTAGALDVNAPLFGYSCPVVYAEDANNVHVEIYRADIIGDGIASDSEIGSIMAFGNPSTPVGFLPCDGSEVSRVTYAELFAAIGTNFGIGDGSTTFNLPNLEGQFLRGWSSDASVDPDGPREAGSTQVDGVGPHAHRMSTEGNPNVPIGNGQDYAGGANPAFGGNTENYGSGIISETRPKNVAVRFYIRYAAKGAVEAENKVNPTVIIPDLTTDIDWQTGEVFTESRAADKTFTFSNTQDGKTIIVSIENTDVADHTINFPLTVSWPGGVPVNNVVAGTTTVFTFVDFAGTIRATAVESF
jgi:microcystin-dependent protein